MSSTDDEARAELVAKLRALSRSRGYSSSGELFRAFDDDKDGALQPHELKALLAAAGVGSSLTRGIYVSRIFDRLNADGSDGLTLGELNGVLRELEPAPPPATGMPAQGAQDGRTAPFGTMPPERPAEDSGSGLVWLILVLLFALEG